MALPGFKPGEDWEDVARGVRRLLVPGGWLYRVHMGYLDGDEQMTVVFVQDPDRVSS
jgi:hypothetical protein